MDGTTMNVEYKQLLATGWKLFEIKRLCKIRDRYLQNPLDQADLDIRHLEFIRWLVRAGRLEG